MKKIAGKIAMILILVMLAGSFTSCLSYWGRSHEPLKRVAYAVVDIVFLPISLIALLIYVIITQEANDQNYLAGLDTHSLEYFSLYQKMYSLPEAELASLMQTLHSIPEAARVSTMEKFNSIPEATLASLVTAYNALPQSDILSSLERIVSLPETELVSLLQSFNDLTETELDSVIASINSQAEMDNVAFADNVNPFEAVEAKALALVY